MIESFQTPALSRDIDIGYESLKLYFYLLSQKHFKKISDVSDSEIPEEFKSLIHESIEFVKKDSDSHNSSGLELLSKFHKLFLAISNVLEDKYKEDFLQLFTNKQHLICPSQRFIESIRLQLNFGNPKVKQTLNHAINYYLMITEKYQQDIKKEFLLHSRSSEDTDLIDSVQSDKLIRRKIVKEVLLNSLIGFFGKGNDNPFLCLDGTISRLTYAKMGLETKHLLFETAISDIVDKETSKAISLINDPGNHIHIPHLLYYLLYSDRRLITEIDQFFKISIPAFDLRQALEFIKEFPERLNLTIAKNIENLYENIVRQYTADTSDTTPDISKQSEADKFAITKNFLDSLNLSLDLEQDDEKLKMENFFDTVEICHDKAKKGQIITLINSKYLYLITKKTRDFTDLSSIINTQALNYFKDFPCDLFYQDSSVLDLNKIDNLINLINPNSEENDKKKIALIILDKILSGYKMSFERGGAGINDPKTFLYLYFNIFLRKFQEKYHADFIEYIKSFKDLDFESYYPQEIIDNIIEFKRNSDSQNIFNGKRKKLCEELIIPLFQLGIAKNSSRSESRGRLNALNLILDKHPFNQLDHADKSLTITFLINYGQEDLIDAFFERGFFRQYSDRDINLLIAQAILQKNKEAISKILNLIKNKIPTIFSVNPINDLIKPLIEQNFIEGIDAALEAYSEDEIENLLNSYGLKLIQETLIRNKPEALKKILELLKKNKIDSKNILSIFTQYHQTSDDDFDTFKYVLSNKRSELFKILIEEYSEQELLIFLSKRKYLISGKQLNLLELSCHYNSEDIFIIIFEILKKHDFDLKEIIEKEINPSSSINLNIFLFAALRENRAIVNYLVDNYPKEQFNEFLKLCLEKIIFATDQKRYNFLEYICSDLFNKEKTLDIFLTLLQKNQFDLKKIILEPKDRDSKTLFELALTKTSNNLILKILLDKYPADQLLDLLQQQFVVYTSGFPSDLDTIGYFCFLRETDILLSIFNKINIEQSPDFLKIINNHLKRGGIVKKILDDFPTLVLPIFMISIKINYDEFLLDFINQYPADNFLNLLKQEFKVNISGDPIDLDIIEYLCLNRKTNILLSIFSKINTRQSPDFLKIVREHLEGNRVVKKFFYEFPILSTFPFVMALKNNNKEFLSAFVDQYPADKFLVFLKQTTQPNILGDPENLDMIEYCFFHGKTNILNSIFKKISENQPLELEKIYDELFEKKFFKDFLNGDISTVCNFIQELILSKNNKLLSRFFDEYPHEKLTKLLSLSFDFNENSQYNKRGHNLLTFACRYNNAEAARILLSKCPEDKLEDFFNHRLNDELSLNAFLIASTYGGVELIKVLLEKRPKCFKEIELLEMQNTHSLEDKTENNCRAIRLAAGEENLAVAEFFINKYQELTDGDPEKLLEYIKKMNNLGDTILTVFSFNMYLEYNRIKQYLFSQGYQNVSSEEIKILVSDNNKFFKLLEEMYVDFVKKILDKIPKEKKDEFINHKNICGENPLSFAASDDYEALELIKILILNGAIINYLIPNENSDNDKEKDDIENLNKRFLQNIYAILKKITDEEISQEKITNPITFSNLLLLKAIADLEELSEEQKIATIDKLIEKTNQDKSLVDMVIEGYKNSDFNTFDLFIRDAQITSESFGDLDGLDQDHNRGFSQLAQGNSGELELASSQDDLMLDLLPIETQPADALLPTNLTQENPIELFSLLNPDQSEQGKFIEKELLNELAIKIRNALDSSLIKRKRGIDDSQTPESLLKKLKEARETPSEGIRSAHQNTQRSETSSRNSPSPSSPKGEAMTNQSYQSP